MNATVEQLAPVEQQATNNWVVAALYQFKEVADAADLQKRLLDLVNGINLCGTLIVASEGINGTVAGDRAAIDTVHQFLLNEGFSAMEYKESTSSEKPFRKMKIKLKNEIVTLGVEVKPRDLVGHYLDPKEWNELISRDDVILVDTRNDYEVQVGTFQGAIDPKTEKFRDFPAWWQAHAEGLKGKRIAMSGYGNVGWGIMKKIDELGGKVTYFAGPDGYIHDPDGVCGEEKLNFILEMRAKDPMHCKPYADKFGVDFVEGQKCWGVKDVDVYMPAAMQNDVKMESAEKIAASGVKYYIEVANMPTTNDALNFLRAQKHMIVAPSKAVNAGGVGVSALEMAQNSERLVWTAEEVDAQLHKMMKTIHKESADAAAPANGQEDGNGGFTGAADIAGDQASAAYAAGPGLGSVT